MGGGGGGAGRAILHVRLLFWRLYIQVMLLRAHAIGTVYGRASSYKSPSP